jgi:dihydrolipoamide dehydrogenase
MNNHPATQGRDLIVVGAGPGGYTAAFLAADHGRTVTLVDPGEQPGGVCLNRGCIPSKTLLHIAKIINEAREAAEHGLNLQFSGVDLDKLRAWKNDVVAKNASGLRQLAKARRVDVVRATASFADSRTVELNMIGSEVNRIERFGFNDAIIATGSLPATLPGLDTDSPRIMDSTAALDLPDVPGSLLVVGGGYIGMEIGTIYAALGSRVTLVEMTADLLAGADRDLVRVLQIRLKKTFAGIMLKSKVASITDSGRDVSVTIVTDGATSAVEQTYDRVLVATGRIPNSRSLNLEAAGVQVDQRGFVLVDQHRRTANGHIFAIGDVVGGPMLAHKASHEARAVVETLAGEPAQPQTAVVPAVVFTDPEIGWAGMTETEAAAQGIPFELAKFPWSASGRAASIGRTDGLTKILVSPDDKRILGIGIVGAGAGELLAEGVLAIETSTTARDLARCIHAHPTLSETVGEAAEAVFGTTPHIYHPKR